MTTSELPRLLYVGDVPVEASYHGSALLFRLLQRYPPERLRIVEDSWRPSLPSRRLPGVSYRAVANSNPRWLNTRLHRWYSTWLSLKSVGLESRVSSAIEGFTPDAVLTVAHGYLWTTAAAFARRQRLPLHLVVHDDWPGLTHMSWPFANRIDHQFGRIYRKAASRLCASPFMVEEYQRRYGADGEVLYPSRAHDATVFGGPPARPSERGPGLVFAFAGTINTPGYVRLLRTLADGLVRHAGRLLIFGPLTPQDAARAGLDRSNVQLGGLVPARELLVAFVPKPTRYLCPCRLTQPIVEICQWASRASSPTIRQLAFPFSSRGRPRVLPCDGPTRTQAWPTW